MIERHLSRLADAMEAWAAARFNYAPRTLPVGEGEDIYEPDPGVTWVNEDGSGGGGIWPTPDEPIEPPEGCTIVKRATPTTADRSGEWDAARERLERAVADHLAHIETLVADQTKRFKLDATDQEHERQTILRQAAIAVNFRDLQAMLAALTKEDALSTQDVEDKTNGK